MSASEGKTIAIEYTLKSEGNVVDTNVGAEPLEYLHGQGQIIPGLEKAIEGMNEGETKTVSVAPQDAYGDLNEEAIVEVPKAQIPEEAQKIGAVLETKSPEGALLRGQVAEIKEEVVILDFNHPLAGKTLEFEVKVVSIS